MQFVLLAATWHAVAQDAKTLHPNMAPIEQYLMEDRRSEIAMARSDLEGPGSSIAWGRRFSAGISDGMRGQR